MSSYFDPWKTFDASPEEKKAVAERLKIREALKLEFKKKYTDPYRPTTGYIFDPAFQRNYSARFTFDEYFKPSKYMLLGGFAVLIPFSIMSYFLVKARAVRHHKMNTGQIAYKDRMNQLNP